MNFAKNILMPEISLGETNTKKGLQKISRKTSFLIKLNDTLTIAKNRIESNSLDIVFVINNENKIVGSISEGDISRYLKMNSGCSLEDYAEYCMCRTPVIVKQGEQRRNILKHFDQYVHAIPEVDEQGKLVSVITVNDFKFPQSHSVVSHAKSPVRISFSGGGTDLSYFFSSNDGVVLNTTIRKYSHAILVKRSDSRIILYSGDYNFREEIEHISSIDYQGKLGLLKAVIKLLNPDYGFELTTFSEVPLGSGLGGSSVIASAVIGCFNKFRDDELTFHEIAELAFQAERIELNIQGGWQDQYATVFGGFNFIEFFKNDTVVHPLRLHSGFINELESNLILCYSGKVRNSGELHKRQEEIFTENGKNILPLLQRSKEIAIEMKNCLLRGDINGVGVLLDETWSLKRQYSPLVTDSTLDQIYTLAKQNGAIGGKLLGAGGGGYFLFYTNPFQRNRLERALKGKGLIIEPVVFDKTGLRSWTTKEIV